MPRPITRLVKLREACDMLAVSRRTFWEKWHQVFTDPRPAADRRKGCERKVYEDELSIAIEQSSQCPAAVLNHRRLVRRLT